MLQEKTIMIPQLISISSSACLLPELFSATELSTLYKKYIPPMIARSCSTGIKMALTVASQAIENHSIDYAVFCSEHGELKCGLDLLADLSKGELLSPADFSRSVHNTASGIFTIIHKMQKNTTSIASGKNTFLNGIISALAWLKLHPGSQVLLTFFDDYIPVQYQSLSIPNDQQYAVAFLLSNRKTNKKMFSVSVENHLAHSDSANKIADGLLFYKWLSGSETTFLIKGDCHTEIVLKRNRT